MFGVNVLAATVSERVGVGQKFEGPFRFFKFVQIRQQNHFKPLTVSTILALISPV